ncbi:MAG: oxidoreductase [Herbiconiux sp.]|uniref:ferredoxin reductase family protein n=1 Tax=Herbiconiux sp. TaxID=1871186 RepID=UPI001223DA53|nr:ferric reductase-like transmembrane domain-containing protein [Herbiconiux sp.]TAJ49489.1 MAG: oxidoreductase [Herbiconiux sp.]
MAGIDRFVRRRSRAAFAIWVALYTLLVVLPLPLALIRLDPGRGFWINLSVAFGFVGLAMFGLQFVMVARSFVVVHPVGMDLVLGFHRQMAYLATLLVFAHPIILFVVDTRFLGLLDVFTSPMRAKFAVASCALLLAIIVLSVFRRRLRVSYEAWQITHAVLALAVVVTALAHVLLVGYYVREWWEQALWIVLSAAFVGLGVWVRLLKPVLRRRRPWVVESIDRDIDAVTTITIRPKQTADAVRPGTHSGPADLAGGLWRPFHFEPGQFAWLQARRSAFALTYHPFSISSSAEHPEHIRFSIKAHENFSRDIAELVPGDTVYVDGPFGAFVLPPAGPIVFVGTGVGVTPLLSMLETLADRGDTRRCELWLGNRDERSIAGRSQLEALEQRLDLSVVHLLSRPSAEWQGPKGHIDAAFVRARLPLAAEGSSFCICGPDAMMDEVERTLADLGVHHDVIHSERFGMV